MGAGEQPERPAEPAAPGGPAVTIVPAGKSKTGLRRGQFTPGNTLARKAPAPRRDTTTTSAEQALLFDEGSAGPERSG